MRKENEVLSQLLNFATSDTKIRAVLRCLYLSDAV
jgi:hypothetical protein